MNLPLSLCPKRPRLVTEDGHTRCDACGERIVDVATLTREELTALAALPVRPCVAMRFRPDGSLILRVARVTSVVLLAACAPHREPRDPLPAPDHPRLLEPVALRTDTAVPPGQLVLSVVEDHGFVSTGVHVTVRSGAVVVFNGYTDEDGRVVVRGLAAGDYTVELQSHASPQRYPFALTAAAGVSGVICQSTLEPLFLGMLRPDPTLPRTAG